jgi:hypothetical protein
MDPEFKEAHDIMMKETTKVTVEDVKRLRILNTEIRYKPFNRRIAEFMDSTGTQILRVAERAIREAEELEQHKLEKQRNFIELKRQQLDEAVREYMIMEEDTTMEKMPNTS